MVRALLYHPSISIAPQRRSTNEFARWKKDHDRKFSNFHQSARRLFSLLPFLMLHNTEKQALKIFLLPLSLSLLPPLIILWLAICFSFFDTTWPNSEFHRSDCYYCFKFPLSEWLTAFIRSFFAVFFCISGRHLEHGKKFFSSFFRYCFRWFKIEIGRENRTINTGLKSFVLLLLPYLSPPWSTRASSHHQRQAAAQVLTVNSPQKTKQNKHLRVRQSSQKSGIFFCKNLFIMGGEKSRKNAPIFFTTVQCCSLWRFMRIRWCSSTLFRLVILHRPGRGRYSPDTTQKDAFVAIKDVSHKNYKKGQLPRENGLSQTMAINARIKWHLLLQCLSSCCC